MIADEIYILDVLIDSCEITNISKMIVLICYDARWYRLDRQCKNVASSPLLQFSSVHFSLWVTGTFVPTYFRSRWVELSFPGTVAPWNFRSMELSSPGTFAPESENNVELSLPECKMACNFHSTPCPQIVCSQSVSYRAVKTWWL